MTNKMAKLSVIDKMRIQTLREQGCGAKAICKAYPHKRWSLCTVKKVCKRVDERGSAIERKVGSGRPRTARTAENINAVGELLCSQEKRPGMSKSTRQVALQLQISQRSVRNIAHKDLGLKSYKRVAVQVITEATVKKRLERCEALLRRLKAPDCKRVFFTDEKAFYLDPPVCSQNDRVWSAGRKKDIAPERLLLQRAKFSQHVMVSAGVCFSGKGTLHFVAEKVKIDAEHYTSTLLPQLLNDCRVLLADDFVFQQDGAPAHTAHQTQEYLQANTPDFIGKDEWPPNSPDLNPLDYCVWGLMLHSYKKLSPKPKSLAELKIALQTIWDELPLPAIQKAILSFRKRLESCVGAEGGHFEHLLK